MTTYLRDLTLEVVSYYADSCRRTPAAGQWPIAPQNPRSGDGSSLLPGAMVCAIVARRGDAGGRVRRAKDILHAFSDAWPD